jgi:hypothetical protein
MGVAAFAEMGLGRKEHIGMALAKPDFAVNWLFDSVRWTWLIMTFVAFVVCECAAVYYLYRFLGWL